MNILQAERLVCLLCLEVIFISHEVSVCDASVSRSKAFDYIASSFMDMVRAIEPYGRMDCLISLSLLFCNLNFVCAVHNNVTGFTVILYKGNKAV